MLTFSEQTPPGQAVPTFVSVATPSPTGPQTGAQTGTGGDGEQVATGAQGDGE